MGYKVIADEVTVLEAIAEFRDPLTGEVTAYDHRANTYLKGEVVPDNKVSPLIVQALEEADDENPTYAHLKNLLEKEGDGNAEILDVTRRLGLPFDDYDSLSEEEVLNTLRVLSGPLVQAVKEYEAANAGRREILEYNAGTREGVLDRVEGKVIVSDRQDAAEDKPTTDIQTRSVEGTEITPGEGFTGSDTARERGKAARESKARGSGESTRRAARRSRGGGSEAQNPDSSRDGAKSE